MAKHFADIRIDLTVCFEDDGDNSLEDQAIEAGMDKLREVFSLDDLDGIEIVGPVRTHDLPSAKASSGGNHE